MIPSPTKLHCPECDKILGLCDHNVPILNKIVSMVSHKGELFVATESQVFYMDNTRKLVAIEVKNK